MEASRDEVCFEPVPPDSERHTGWDIDRAPPKGALDLVCVSADFLGLRTHFFERRTVPHLKGACAACAKGYPSTWHAYLLAIEAASMRRIVFETTAAGEPVLSDARSRRGSLRGFRFLAMRAAERDNARVVLIPKEGVALRGELPADESLWDILCRIWRLPAELRRAGRQQCSSGTTQAERIAGAPKRPARRAASTGVSPVSELIDPILRAEANRNGR